MKNLFMIGLVMLITIGLGAAHANPDFGNIVFGEGEKRVRIEVGPERMNRYELIERVRMLERAVMDLQDYVYQLDHVSAVETIWTCKVEGRGKDFYFGSGPTMGIAEANAYKACQDTGYPFCDDVQCTDQ